MFTHVLDNLESSHTHIQTFQNKIDSSKFKIVHNLFGNVDSTFKHSQHYFATLSTQIQTFRFFQICFEDKTPTPCMMTPIKLRHALAPRDFEVSSQDALKLQTLFANIVPSSHQVSSVHVMAGLAIKPYVDNGPDLDASLDSFLLDKVVITRQHQQLEKTKKGNIIKTKQTKNINK